MGAYWARRAAFALAVGVSSSFASAELAHPDEPGINPNRDYVHQHFAEHIDPYNGNLQLHYVDIFLPGAGGFDLKVQRSYNALLAKTDSPFGRGWQIHFGRVSHRADQTCESAFAKTMALEMPDGGVQTLYRSNGVAGSAAGIEYITTSMWKAKCSPTGVGIIVSSPDGTKYEITEPDGIFWHVSRIEDRDGNSMSFQYVWNTTFGRKFVKSISTTDLRGVTFNYGASDRLSSIVAEGRTWNYSVQVGADLIGYLKTVTPPAGSPWQYSYFPDRGATTAGSFALQSLTYPQGGTISYDYQFVNFLPNLVNPRSWLAVTSKRTTDGEWRYAYTPSTTVGILDRTVVTLPGTLGSMAYEHFGYRTAVQGEVWKIGLLIRKTSSNQVGTAQVEDFTFENQAVSNETQARQDYGLIDPDVFRPLLKSRKVTRDTGTFETIYQSRDVAGNPTSIAETGTDTRARSIPNYFNDASRWILGLPLDETIQGVGTISRTRYSNGRLWTEAPFGVSTTYSYTSQGDLLSRRSARNFTTTFSDFFRGIARTEARPEQVGISRLVNDFGNVEMETDGEFTWRYSYDGLNRVTRITYPVGLPADISWTDRRRTLTRGAYAHITDYDAYGRVKSITRGGIPQVFDVDALGRKIQETLPGSASAITYELDVLGRPVSISSPAGTRQYTYHAASTSIQNERGLTTTYTYTRYGDPDDGYLVGIDAGAGTAVTMSRNKVGTLLSATQAGVLRTYGRDSHLFLASITEQETGTTTFGRDELGNLKSKTVSNSLGSETVNYAYDGLDRLKTITHPGAAGLVSFTYDRRGKVTAIESPSVTRNYGFDGNGNLKRDELHIDGREFATLYGYDEIDGLRDITYPSGGTVSYSPDALGRPQAASPYLTAVEHHPSGNLSSLAYANGIVTTIGENAWQLPNTISAPLAEIGLTYGYDGVGNLKTIGDSYGGTYDRTLDYDAADRLTVANGPWGSGTLSYSGDGNLKFQQFGSYRIDYVYQSGRLASLTGSRPMTFSYDKWGNVTGNGSTTFGYDAASHMTCAKCGTQDEVKYQYDGQGRRVSEEKGGYKTYFLQAPNGDLQYEYTPYGKVWTKHAYLHGKRIASESDSDALPTATAMSGPATASYGAAITFNVTVSPSATGTVEIREGATVYATSMLTTSQATVQVGSLPVGSHSLVAAYLGDANNAPSTSVVKPVEVARRLSTVAMAASPGGGSLGQAVTLTATVAGSSPTGDVQFLDGSSVVGTASVTGGVASFTTQALLAGSHAFGATYLGDSNHFGSSASQAAVTISQGASTVSAASSNSASYEGQAVTLSATVAAIAGIVPTGSISFFEAGVLLSTSNLSAGFATLTTNTLSPGLHAITASYSGDANYAAASSTPLYQQVTSRTATSTQMTLPTRPTYSNQWVTVTVAVTASNPGGAVRVISDGIEVGSAALTAGTARVRVRLPVGTHVLQATYDGDQLNANSSSSTASVSIRPGQQPQDMNLDGKTDLLWFRASDRNAMSWQMDGTVIDTNSPAFGTAPVGFALIGVGDFDGNGTADLLWFRLADRMVSIQASANGPLQNVATLETGWLPGQAVDFDGDGNADIFWFHSDGRALVWKMNGVQLLGSSTLAGAGPGYAPMMAADFNGDGYADVLSYRASDSMFKLQLTNSAAAEIGANPLGLELRGAGDLNGDGIADLVWFNPLNRAASAWLMNGIVAPTMLALGQGAADFELIGAADFNADGKADGVWSRASDAMLALQFTNGAWALVDNADPGWVLKGVGQAFTTNKSVVTSPAASSTVTSSTLTLVWNAGTLVDERYLTVGTTPGGGEIYAGGYQGTALSRQIKGIPLTGAPIYVRLSSWINGAWQANDVTYSTAAPGPPAKSVITSPTAGSVLPSSTVTFSWDAGVAVTDWFLSVGASPGVGTYYSSYASAGSAIVSGLPTDGSSVYVTLSSWINGAWQGNDYTYTASSSGGGAPRASALTTPVPGSHISSPTATFGWDAGSGVTDRYLSVGSTLGGGEIYGGYQGASLSATVSGIPAGQTIYVRLLSWVNGGWVASDASYLSN